MDIHDRLLGKEVIDTEDRVFREYRMGNAVQFLSRGQIASEWLFDDDPRTRG